MGDALVWLDRRTARQGFRFDGRIAEDFKLATGTWVSVGPLRAHLVQRLGRWVRDVVIAAPDRDFLGVLAIPARAGDCRTTRRNLHGAAARARRSWRRKRPEARDAWRASPG